MSNILKDILSYKRKLVDERKALFPVKLLERSIYYDTKTVSLKKYLDRPDKAGIIAEIKRKSPSKGMINPYISVEKLSIGYMRAGASALSVLTDTEYFGGSNEDLITARKYNFCPLLRKDFIIDEYQVHESKSIGADTILLIASALPHDKLVDLIHLAHNLGLEVLMEIHDEEEWHKVKGMDLDLIGVNNRDLKTFEVSLQTALKIAELLPADLGKVAESGIKSADDVRILKKHGYTGFLIGQQFMENSRPEVACKSFIRKLKNNITT